MANEFKVNTNPELIAKMLFGPDTKLGDKMQLLGSKKPKSKLTSLVRQMHNERPLKYFMKLNQKMKKREEKLNEKQAATGFYGPKGPVEIMKRETSGITSVLY